MKSELTEKIKWNIRIILTCPNTNQDVTVSAYDTVHANQVKCELCGTHGEIYIRFNCVLCGKEHRVSISRW
jgi:transcription elongation factor Elf1